MKAIGRLLAGCTLSALVLTSNATGSTSGITTQVVVGQLCLGQADPSSPGERRRQSDHLLKLARQAMKEGNFVLAEKHVARAESLGASYDSLFAKFEDTPVKVRRDLDQLRQRVGGSTGTPVAQGPQRPSERFSPYKAAANAPRTSAPPAAPFGTPNREAALSAMTNGAKAKASDFLQRGRAALSQRNMVGAIGWWQKAVATGAKFEVNEYSPQQLAAELRAAGVDAARLTPPSPNANGLTLKPSDIAKSDLERLPPPRGAAGPPQSSFQRGAITSPSQLPANNNPLAGNNANKMRASQLVAQGMAALGRDDLLTAKQLAQQAEQLNVPASAFGQGETRPWELSLRVDQALRRRGGVGGGVTPASAVAPAGGVPPAGGVVPAGGSVQIRGGRATASLGSYPVKQGVYDPGADTTRMRMAQAEVVTPSSGPSSGRQLFEDGMRALEGQDVQGALDLFRQAWQYEAELDPLTRQELQVKLSQLSASGGVGREPSRFDEINMQADLVRQQIFHEIGKEEEAANRMLQDDPKGALELMQRLRDRVSVAQVEPTSRDRLVAIVDRKVNEIAGYIEAHRAEIELDERNREILTAIDRENATKLEVQDQIAQLIERFNTLLEEQRFAEAQVIAKQVRELDPESPIARTLLLKASFVSRIQEDQSIRDRSEDGFVHALLSIDESGIPFDDRDPYVHGDAREWQELSRSRRELLESQRRRLSPVEMRIQRALDQQVDVRFSNRPLREVLDTLASISGVNIYPDTEGMAAEGVSTDTPVSITLAQPISLKSALHLILEPLRLSYVIQHEVLRITSEQARNTDTYTRTYNVADLVIPIPNFVPGYNVGLPAALREAHRSLGYGGIVQPAALSPSPLTISNDMTQPGSTNSSVLAQTGAYGMMPQGTSRPTQLPGSPGAAGGAALADFDTLIELITSTVEPDSWDTLGGPGAIESFPTNLSLVISQTQDVHDQIADLLEQLRRLQDLQVTIEVRFITLQDNWFERIGVDFDFDIDDNVLQLPRDDSGNSVTIGLNNAGMPTADLDLSFNQGSFGLATPAFGGFQAANAATFGFAILSDIEAFFLLEAATGDTRSNVLQAPKVTLFNGQLASVNDTSQRPFVTSLIPVVGDFAAAHQPVIVVLSEGTSLNVQAVVSADRRFVRLTLQPVFSQIGNVETFTFEGTTTTDTGTNVIDAAGDATGNTDNVINTTTGTTVQLPTFSFTTVSTTVSVPDGGTILLGGIKRLREGRNEHGVPMLSKIPYVSRLFRNVGIGRDTQSLMLMVTPRIIIQEEEEANLGIEQ